MLNDVQPSEMLIASKTIKTLPSANQSNSSGVSSAVELSDTSSDRRRQSPAHLRDEKYQCGICTSYSSKIYRCPRCSNSFCSLRCYRSEAHRNCSEKFYKECVEDEMKRNEETASPAERSGPQFTSFEDYMAKFNESHKANRHNSDDDSDDAEPLDSDDDGVCDDYLEDVLKMTRLDTENRDEKDVDRELLIKGVGSGVQQLMNVLLPSEKEAFEHLAHEYYIEENDLEKSVFKKH